jgi:hypothetical protein
MRFDQNLPISATATTRRAFVRRVTAAGGTRRLRPIR